uniref:Uncharacterized protein n=1 Tax=Caenorhabditis tropicalis TaxID=1561998 RepID=A0A1I7TY17_9PELO
MHLSSSSIDLSAYYQWIKQKREEDKADELERGESPHTSLTTRPFRLRPSRAQVCNSPRHSSEIIQFC